MRAFSRCTLLALLLLATGSAAAQTRGSTPAIWEVRSQTNVVYLLGTIHVGRADMYPLGDAVEKSYRASRVVALELDPLDIEGATQAMMALMRPTDSTRVLSPDLVARLERMGLPVQAFRQLSPFVTATVITLAQFAHVGFDASHGVDQHFARRAREDGKRLVQLESHESQAALINSLSPGLQERFLDHTLQLIEKNQAAALIRKMMAAWRSGDAQNVLAISDAIGSALPAAMQEEFTTRFLRERNVAMAQKVETMLQGSEPHFVAVGTLHLVGPDSVLALLPRRYSVRRL